MRIGVFYTAARLDSGEGGSGYFFDGVAEKVSLFRPDAAGIGRGSER